MSYSVTGHMEEVRVEQNFQSDRSSTLCTQVLVQIFSVQVITTVRPRFTEKRIL